MFRLFRYGAHVKPERAGDERSRWITTYGPYWRDLLDDWQRYGWRVALYNLKVLFAGGPPETE